MSLAYRLDQNRAGTMKEFGIGLLKSQRNYRTLLALKDVSLTVGRGEVFAVIGPNGAGKSTLMKVIARVLPPTDGRVIVRGTVAPMIALGAGFNPELTARENIVLYGTLLGRNHRFMRERAEPIAHWAGLEDFLEVPIRNYSSGMVGRLAFSVATDVDPDILVVDEILSVGDQAFKAKSRDRISAMIERGISVVLVSHALGMVKRLAKRVMWLDQGDVKAIGAPAEVIEAYEATQ